MKLDHPSALSKLITSSGLLSIDEHPDLIEEIKVEPVLYRSSGDYDITPDLFLFYEGRSYATVVELKRSMKGYHRGRGQVNSGLRHLVSDYGLSRSNLTGKVAFYGYPNGFIYITTHGGDTFEKGS